MPEMVKDVLAIYLRDATIDKKEYLLRRKIPGKKVDKYRIIANTSGLTILANNETFIVKFSGDKYPGKFQNGACTCVEFCKWNYCKHYIVIDGFE